MSLTLMILHLRKEVKVILDYSRATQMEEKTFLF